MGNQLILVVQIQHPELFPLKRGHMQSQPFTYGVGEVKATPGSCRWRSRALSAR
jgi:hypothetical protein